MRPITYKLFKGMTAKWGALNLSMSDSHFYKGKEKDFNGSQAFENGKLKDGWDEREGCVFLEMTSATGPNVYDWANKVTMALSVTDMGKLLYTLATGEECNIMHDPGAKGDTAGQIKKYLKVSSPQGLKSGVMFMVNQTQGEQKKSHTVPVSPDEVMVLRTLISAAISRSLNW